jgi:thiol-disulfide isomerase/thioredoxin
MKTFFKSNPRSVLAIVLLIGALCFQACGGSGSDETSTEADYATTIESASFKALESDERINVSDFEGKIVLVDFWETWCVPCLQAMPTFKQVIEDYPDKFVVLAVSPGWSDTPEDVIKFRDENGFPFVFVLDDTDIATKLEITGIPYKVFIGPDGKYISTELGTGGHQRDYAKIVEIIEKASGSAAIN